MSALQFPPREFPPRCQKCNAILWANPEHTRYRRPQTKFCSNACRQKQYRWARGWRERLKPLFDSGKIRYAEDGALPPKNADAQVRPVPAPVDPGRENSEPGF